MFGQTALFALALAAPALSQVTEGFENGWDQTAWPTYAPDCSQGGKVTLDSTTAHTGKNSIRVEAQEVSAATSSLARLRFLLEMFTYGHTCRPSLD